MLELSQILAITIFAVMFITIVIGKIHRYIPALIGAALVIIVVFIGVMRSPEAVLSVLNLGQLGQAEFWIPGGYETECHGVNWQTIIFIGGMMIMVEGMGKVVSFAGYVWLLRRW